MLITVFFIYIFTISLNAANIAFYPGGITLQTHYANDENRYIIKQNKKTIGEFSAYSIKVIAKNSKQIIFQAISKDRESGKMDFYVILPKLKKAYFSKIELNTFKMSRKDLDKDGSKEWIFFDNHYDFLYGLCDACSPTVKVVADLQNGKLTLRPKLMQKYTKPNKKQLHSSKVRLDEFGHIEINSDYSPDVLMQILFEIYIGKSDKAARLIKKYFQFQNNAQLELFLQQLVDALQSSPFWDQIKVLNGWQWETACQGENCTPPVELYDKDDVVQKLFRYIKQYNDIKSGL